MAEVTSELIIEVLHKIQGDVQSTRSDILELKQEMISIRGHLLSVQTDVHNIYNKLDRHDVQLARIERRLELRELAETRTPYEP